MKEISLEELADSGLLFEINRRVLHPLGISMELAGSPAQLRITRTSDPVGFTYSPSAFEQGELLLGKFMEDVGDDKLAIRKSLLRYVEQESADQGEDSVRPSR